ncbi:MAG: hypothetical protein ACO1N4_00410 [Pedobacter sp.]
MENREKNENLDNKEKEVKVDLIDIDDDTKPGRSEENIELAAKSTISSKFSKTPPRKHEPMGGSHEPGTTPGTNF